MNLHDELNRLADAAPPVVDTERVIRLAQGVKTRRMVGIPALAFLAILVAVVPLVTRPRAASLPTSLGAQPSTQESPQEILFRVDTPSNVTVDQKALERTREIVEARAKALGFQNVVTTIKDDKVVLESVSAKSQDVSAALTAPGRLHVRKVLDTYSYSTEAVKASPAPAKSDTPPSADAVVAKLGKSYEYAVTLAGPQEAQVARLTVFEQLNAAEVALLPVNVQFNVPTIRCTQLNGRAVDLAYPPEKQITACDALGDKHLLDVAKVVSADVAGATAQVDPRVGGPVVQLRFKTASVPKWTELSREATENKDGACKKAAVGDQGHCRLAFMIDGQIVMAPQIMTVLISDVVDIQSDFTLAAAKSLAAQISSGELPLKIVDLTKK